MSSLGRYVLRERIGVGGMGEVFLAVTVGAAGFEKKVVVKRLLPNHAEDDTVRGLFMAEAMLLSKLSHPNIVSVIDFGIGDRKDYFVVLEYVDGVDLHKLLRVVEGRGERLSEKIALRIAAGVLRGLAFAHELAEKEQKVLVHRDVTPGNVLLSKAGEVRVADFGVTMLTEAGTHGDGLVAGKPSWMSPEQLADQPLDPRSDIFSVGVLLHRMIAGALPFQGSDRQEEPPKLKASPETQAIVTRALANDRNERFARAREMLAAIEELPQATQDQLGDLVGTALSTSSGAHEAVLVLRAPKGEDLKGTELTLHRDVPSVTDRPTVPERPLPRSRLWPKLVPIPILLAVVAWFAWPARTTAPVVASTAIATATASDTAAPTSPPLAPPSASVAVSATASVPRVVAARPSTSASVKPTASAPPSDCRGAVWLRADHAWRVTAGSVVAEAPDRATWPCGTYDVVATSKLDPSMVRHVQITISPTATATVDLR